MEQSKRNYKVWTKEEMQLMWFLEKKYATPKERIKIASELLNRSRSSIYSAYIKSKNSPLNKYLDYKRNKVTFCSKAWFKRLFS